MLHHCIPISQRNQKYVRAKHMYISSLLCAKWWVILTCRVLGCQCWKTRYLFPCTYVSYFLISYVNQCISSLKFETLPTEITGQFLNMHIIELELLWLYHLCIVLKWFTFANKNQKTTLYISTLGNTKLHQGADLFADRHS